MTSYGYFDDDNFEYVITDPRTPVKWINYLGTLKFGGFIDQTGGALLCKGDPALNRITKYIPQLPSSEFKGTGLYLRKHLEYGYELLSPFFTPCLTPFEKYECHVGMGYSRFVSEMAGVLSDVTVFIPVDAPVELRIMRFTNTSQDEITMDAVPVVEYTHFEALKQFTNADWVPQTMVSQADKLNDGRVILRQYAFMKKDVAENFLTANIPAVSYDTDRREFLGNNEYGTWKAPGALLQPQLTNSEALRGDNIGALLLELGTLKPGETKTFVTALGQASGKEAVYQTVEQYATLEAAEKALTELKTFWQDYVLKLQVETPAESMNQTLNTHNPRQCYITKNWSRYLSLYQLGFGARGIGFRDTSQDLLGIMGHVPEEGRELLIKLLQVQVRDGSAKHQFNPLTMVANEGDSLEMEDRYHFYSDDHLWAILSTTAYIRETGNTDFLYEVVPFYEKDKEGKPIESGSVLEHLKRAVEFTHGMVGDHGLPLAGFADWNDPTNLPKGAESLFTTFLYGKALKDLIALLKFIGQDCDAEKYQGYYEAMKATANEQAWDGEWYIRYFNFDGSPIGSKTNEKGQIYTNSQSWAVFSGYATPERAEKALDSVNKHLNTRNGIKLSTPGYDGYDPSKGGISTYPPGAKENGGIFLHANPWVMIAETMLGNGARAYQYYNQINPSTRNDRIEEYESEPYCYPQNILGDEHPLFGLARNGWLSGTASWTYVAATQYILGIRPDYDGLIIDPCIPPEWDGFTVKRHFRATWYEIKVSNPQHVSKGVASITVDGKTVENGKVPYLIDGDVHQVEVILG